MLTEVKLHDPTTTVGQVRRLLADDHVHAVVIVEAGALLAVVDRADVEAEPDDELTAVSIGGLGPRTVRVDTPLAAAWDLLERTGRRRLAVVDVDGVFRGLLCLKRSRTGFCSDQDVRARAGG